MSSLFLTAGEFAADEWRAGRSADEAHAERGMRQFVWCQPVAPSKWTETSLYSTELAERITELPRGVVPEGTQRLSAAMDLGKYLEHWIVVAWMPDAVCHIVDYGRIEVASEDLGVEQATMVALREFRALVTDGWPVGSTGGKAMRPELVWIDSGYMTHVVYAFCRETGARFMPAVGRGAARQVLAVAGRDPTLTAQERAVLGPAAHLALARQLLDRTTPPAGELGELFQEMRRWFATR